MFGENLKTGEVTPLEVGCFSYFGVEKLLNVC